MILFYLEKILLDGSGTLNIVSGGIGKTRWLATHSEYQLGIGLARGDVVEIDSYVDFVVRSRDRTS